MPELNKVLYTIVQHSRCGYAKDNNWYYALETRQIDTDAKLSKVRKAGGMVFSKYLDADDYSVNIRVKESQAGSFSRFKIDGLRIWTPNRNLQMDYKVYK